MSKTNLHIAKPASVNQNTSKTNAGFSYSLKNAEFPVNRIQPSKQTIIQPKLEISRPDDEYEKEAGSIADKVMRMADSSFADEKNIQAKPIADTISPLVQTSMNGVSEGVFSSSDLEARINNSKNSGSPLPETSRTFMESGFGADFSHVKIHTDANAAQMNKELNARAFTHGSDIYFNSGRFNTESSSGKHLLAHELTHVVQQKQQVISKKIMRSPLPKEDIIKNAQRYLNKIGFDIGLDNKGNPSIDGKSGQGTTAAIVVYQYSKGLDITGIPDEITMSFLEKDAMNGFKLENIAYIPKNIEKGKGGGRLTDLSYLKKEDTINVAGQKIQKDAATAWAFLLMDARWEGFGGNIFKIVSATRTKEEQTSIWKKKIASLKSDYPNETQTQIEARARKWVANPEGGFPHGTGRALDIQLSVGGTSSDKKSIEEQKSTDDYKWLLKNAEKYGFYNYEAEPWHWEYNPK